MMGYSYSSQIVVEYSSRADDAKENIEDCQSSHQWFTSACTVG
jgi:hypothetical protein